MPDVSLYVAIVAAGTSVISGAVPLVIAWARDTGKEKRAEAKELTREQQEVVGGRRELCVNLLSLARHFRVLMENAYDSRGPVSDPNVEQVRRSVADIASQADKVEFNVPKAGAAAVSLADEARKLALTAEEKNREHGASLAASDFTKFDGSIIHVAVIARQIAAAVHLDDELPKRGRAPTLPEERGHVKACWPGQQPRRLPHEKDYGMKGL